MTSIVSSFFSFIGLIEWVATAALCDIIYNLCLRKTLFECSLFLIACSFSEIVDTEWVFEAPLDVNILIKIIIIIIITGDIMMKLTTYSPCESCTLFSGGGGYSKRRSSLP